eukprot:5530669-Pyramimonas_sp.AAC.1
MARGMCDLDWALHPPSRRASRDRARLLFLIRWARASSATARGSGVTSPANAAFYLPPPAPATVAPAAFPSADK